VDVIGLSLLSGAHKSLFPRVVELARQKGLDKVLIIGGGAIPDEDIPFLKERGIVEIFGPGPPSKRSPGISARMSDPGERMESQSTHAGTAKEWRCSIRKP